MVSLPRIKKIEPAIVDGGYMQSLEGDFKFDLNRKKWYPGNLVVMESQGGFSRFQVVGMIKGFFWASNFLFRDFIG